MIAMDWSEEEARKDGIARVGPGVYLVEVLKAEERLTAKGEPMLVLHFSEVGTGKRVCADYLFPADTERRWLFNEKMIQLGVPKGTPAINADHLPGRKVWIAVDLDPRSEKGYLQVVRRRVWKDMRTGYRATAPRDEDQVGYVAGGVHRPQAQQPQVQNQANPGKEEEIPF